MTFELEVGPQQSLAGESEAFENALRGPVLDRATRFQSLDRRLSEDLRKQLQECAHHDAAPLMERRQRVADLGDAVLPARHGESDPARRLALGQNDPLESVAACPVEIMAALTCEIGAQLAHRGGRQGLVAAHARLAPPAVEKAGVLGKGGAQGDARRRRGGEGVHLNSRAVYSSCRETAESW